MSAFHAPEGAKATDMINGMVILRRGDYEEAERLSHSRRSELREAYRSPR